MKDVNKLFRWGNKITERAVKKLIKQEQIVAGLMRDEWKGEWIALSELAPN